jgi:hypothetical protein
VFTSQYGTDSHGKDGKKIVPNAAGVPALCRLTEYSTNPFVFPFAAGEKNSGGPLTRYPAVTGNERR